MSETAPLTLAAESRAADFTEASICRVLGVSDVPTLNPADLPSYLQRLREDNSARALAMAFWLLRQPGRRAQIAQLIGSDNLARLLRCGFVGEVSPGVVTAQVDLYPCLGDYVFTDPHWADSYQRDHVYQLGTDSYVLARVTPRPGGERALDLCTGSGIHAIQSAHHYQESVGVDINPRALRFSRLNAEINGVQDRCRFLEGDLYAPVEGEEFDLITINPPFVPTPDAQMHVHRTGGESGEIISERVVAGLPRHLKVGGTFSMVLDFPVMRSSTYLQRLCSWLGGRPDPVPGWGVAVLNLGHVSWERYIKDHVPNSESYFEQYQRYLDSYQRLGIYEVGFGNVFIRRLPPGHPGFAVEHVPVTAHRPMQSVMESWLQALTRYTPQWTPDWERDKPRLGPLVQDVWSNRAGDRGLVEFAPVDWSNPLPVSGAAVRFLKLLTGRRTAAALAERWAQRNKLSLEQARQQVRDNLAELGPRLVLGE